MQEQREKELERAVIAAVDTGEYDIDEAIEELEVIFKGKARDAVEMRGFLDKSGIRYSIEPELPY